jgi:hypothetical protein
MGICRLVTIALLFILSTLWVTAQTGPPAGSPLAREIQSGTTSIRQGNYAEAKQHFEKAESMGGPPSAESRARPTTTGLAIPAWSAEVKARVAIFPRPFDTALHLKAGKEK